jgi:hypothetical protein
MTGNGIEVESISSIVGNKHEIAPVFEPPGFDMVYRMLRVKGRSGIE